MGLIGLNEAILIGAAVAALVLGPKKLPELARSLGRAKNEYRRSVAEAGDVVPAAEDEMKDVKDSDG